MNELYNTYRKFGFTGSIHDIVKVQMGGYNRQRAVTKIIKYMIKRVGLNNFIVLTNNVLKTVIINFMHILLELDIQVVSTHDIKKTKSNYIKTII